MYSVLRYELIMRLEYTKASYGRATGPAGGVCIERYQVKCHHRSLVYSFRNYTQVP